MPLKLYNHLTKKIETFKPIKSKIVGLYTCGPTVYNFAHIGNLRTYVFEDILRRTLEYNGYKINHVMNITDVEDKIIRNAGKAKKTIFEFVKPYESAFYNDLKKLNIEPATEYPKATAHIKEMVAIIKKLLDKKLAYKADGSIYFDISKFKKYGRLSGLKSRELKVGALGRPAGLARVDVDEYAKGDAEDFVLWKAAKPGEPSWPAPFGAGRPGWHIECSAMSMKYLGPTFDIHGGAVDLIFPHHENEIAQSEGATGKPFVKYFVEGEHLLVDGEKMSKSLGNVYTLRDIEAKGFNPLAFRYLILTANYRSKLNFTWSSLTAAQNALENLRKAVLSFKKPARPSDSNPRLAGELEKKFTGFVNDDLDTPKALAVLWEVIKSAWLDGGTKYGLIMDFDKVLRLNLSKIKIEKIKTTNGVSKLVEEREKYRKEKNFAKADEVRKKIEKLGWLIEDTSGGPKLKRK
ncbi:cysteine--tRNA ligase [Candidatus Azambacteria bacterium RIFCSPHIGHO2_01_FULL_44_55]|nr:MAG: cysteine--tRNA ligase [Candidatus Azambacteria bacterium RIFCSPLOWO2_01_FULL_44_84]OGD33151.1 MAG: cysteine--tRNA ligase [Candidatus Azambacteria bacterium RIFCSPHIGHO2_02_FULL_45_18]OGD39930.1 MAG: cysteine--tRNA ligase [Candidatus Azambacteria bacterium RIFCSPHIGHO2_01_FULL_44_55]